MDMVIVFLALFFASVAAFSYLAYKLYKKNVERWVQVGHVIWVMLGFLMFLTGFLSGNIVTMVFGLASAFASASLFFTYYVKSELGVKKFLEVIFGAMSIGIIFYGYVITGSPILEIAMLFIVAMILIAFMLSYFLPRIKLRLKCQKK
ncbi:MAG: hypothetical protein QXL46_04865 [Nitrososphaerales archaeon]